MIYARLMPALALILFLGETSGPAIAQGRVVVEIDKVQVVHALAGIVRDPRGAPLSGCNGC